MSKSRMRGHFRYLRFKTFSMTPRTPQCEVFWSSKSSSEFSGVPEDSNPNFFQVLGFTPTLGQSGVATDLVYMASFWKENQLVQTKEKSLKESSWFGKPKCNLGFKVAHFFVFCSFLLFSFTLDAQML